MTKSSEQVCAEVYQLLSAIDMKYPGAIPDIEKWLDNTSAAKVIHTDLLPVYLFGKETKPWFAVKDKHGFIVPTSLETSRKKAIETNEDWSYQWGRYKKLGYKTVKVKIVEVE